MNRYADLVSRVSLEELVAKDFDLKDKGQRYLMGSVHDSLIIDKEKQIFYWNSLEVSGTALDWLTIVKGMPLDDAVLYLKQRANYRDRPDLSADHFEFTPNIYPKLLDLFYEYGKDYRDFWYGRGFTDETIDRFKLGYTGKCYVIPIILNGQLLNFQCRTPDKRIWAWVKGLGTLPFNFDTLQTATSAIVTEAPMNAIALEQIGFKAISQTTGAGAWLKLFNPYLVNLKEIVFVYDNDWSGFIGAKRVAKHFKDRARIFIWPPETPEKYDPDDYLRYAVEPSLGNFLGMIINNSYRFEVVESPTFLQFMRERYATQDGESI